MTGPGMRDGDCGRGSGRDDVVEALSLESVRFTGTGIEEDRVGGGVGLFRRWLPVVSGTLDPRLRVLPSLPVSGFRSTDLPLELPVWSASPTCA